MWEFTLNLNSLTISFCILSARFLKLKFYVFLTSLHIFCLFALERCFFFSLQLDSLLFICTTWTQNNINIAKGNYNLQNPNICLKIFPIIVTFFATNECDSDYKEWCFLLKWMVTKKMFDTNKNVTKMGVIIRRVYYNCIF